MVSSKTKPIRTTYLSMDEQLREYALQAKQYPLKHPKRRRISGKIYSIITDSEELEKFKNSLFTKYHARDSNVTRTVFDDCYTDALHDTEIEVIFQKIDRYNPGEGYLLGLDWQPFCEAIQEEESDSSALIADFAEKIELYHQTVHEALERKNKRQKRSSEYREKTTKELEFFCEDFMQSIQQIVKQENDELQTKLDKLYKGFIDKISKYDYDKSIFSWFKFILGCRFADCKNKHLNYRKPRRKVTDPETGVTTIQTSLEVLISSDAPIYRDGEKTTRDIPDDSQQLDEMIEEINRLIEEDKLEIFTEECVANHPDINFREIQLLRFQGLGWKEMVDNFNNKVVHGTISSNYSRAKKYYLPILEEYLTGELPLRAGTIDVISQDTQNKYGHRRMKGRKDINFRDVVLQRKNEFNSWQALAEHLNVTTKDLTIFYLDNLSHFKLYTARWLRKLNRSSRQK